MQKTLHSLIELQEIDLRLDSLREERGDLPQKVTHLKQTIEAEKAELKSQKKQLEELRVGEKKYELELQSKKEQLKKYESQLYQVKTNKEYDAIASETEAVKREIDTIENSILTDTEMIENLENSITEIEKKLITFTEDYKDSNAELQEKINASSEEEKLLEQEREIVVTNLTKQHMSAYERIRAAKKGGKAVASCNSGVCSGCYSFIPPQKVVEIKNMKKIYHCESCGRILVWDKNEE